MYDAEDPMANRLGIGRDVSLLNTRDLEDKDFWKNPNWDDSLKIHFFSNLVIDGQQRRLFFFNVKIIDQNDKKPTIKNN